MKQSVLDSWHKFSEPLEGRVHKMYLDIKGLVTTGVGNLIDPVSEALKLPWKLDSDDSLATPDIVRADFAALKARQDLAKLHHKFAAKVTRMHLTDVDIDELVISKLLSFERFLKKHHFPDFDEFPADAQLGIMSMSWAVGPGFPTIFKNFKRLVLQGDWEGARAACKIRETNNPGIVPRNANNRLCFSNADVVMDHGLDREKLFWPVIAVPQLHHEEKPVLPSVPPIELAERQFIGLPDGIFEDLREQKLETLKRV